MQFKSNLMITRYLIVIPLTFRYFPCSPSDSLWICIYWSYLYSVFPTHICHKSITLTSQWARWRLKAPAMGLFTQLFIQVQTKETLKLRVTGLCAESSPGTGEFPAQMASYAKNVSIGWRHHAQGLTYVVVTVRIISSPITEYKRGRDNM